MYWVFKKISDAEYTGEEIENLLGLFGIHTRVARLQLGDEFIELTDYLTTGGHGIPEDAKSNDLIFQHIAIVVSDMDKAYGQLRKYNVEHVSTAPQTYLNLFRARQVSGLFIFMIPTIITWN
jgi:hypothetical protein